MIDLHALLQRPGMILGQRLVYGVTPRIIKRIHDVQDRMTPKIKARLTRGITAVKDGANMTQLEQAAKTGSATMGVQAFPWQLLDAVVGDIADVLLDTMSDAADVTAEVFPAGGAHAQFAAVPKVKPKTTISFDRADVDAIAWAKKHAAVLIQKNIIADSKQAIRSIVMDAFKSGAPPRAAARLIREHVGMLPRQSAAVEKLRQAALNKYAKLGKNAAEEKAAAAAMRYAQKLVNQRALMIARTESCAAATAGQRSLWEQAVAAGDLDADKWRRIWIADETERTCDFCKELQDGPGAPIGDQYPGGLDGPPAHPNCLPGNMRVLARNVLATVERRYNGDLVIIHTAGGQRLACTPNHPIATREGWKAAQVLNVGSSVVCSCLGNWDSPHVGDNENMPTVIHEVVKAFGRAPEMSAEPVKVAPEDFHGDGEGSKVAVVRANRLLRNGGDAAMQKLQPKLGFLAAHAKAQLESCFSSAALFLKRMFASLACFMCRADLRRALISIHVAPLEALSCTPGSGIYPGPEKLASDGCATDAVIRREGKFRFAGKVTIANSFLRQPRSVADRSDGNALLPQLGIDHGFGDSEFLAELRRATAGEVFLDEVVAIDRCIFDSHVFNLQTESEIYVAEGILTHNCRCAEGLAALK